MCCHDTPCAKCDPGIEAFYQEKVEQAKAASAYLKTTGVEMHYENFLDAKDIWYEYCSVKNAEKQEVAEESVPDDVIKNPINSW